MENKEQNLRPILNVSLDEERNQYHIDVGAGSSMEDVFFAMAVAIKCFTRDKIIESAFAAEALLHKYLTDPQYEEGDA